MVGARLLARTEVDLLVVTGDIHGSRHVDLYSATHVWDEAIRGDLLSSVDRGAVWRRDNRTREVSGRSNKAR